MYIAVEKKDLSGLQIRPDLTHLSRMELPTTISWTNPFPFKGLYGGILHFIQISIEYFVSKQWRHIEY